jgi:hypothetical protein
MGDVADWFGLRKQTCPRQLEKGAARCWHLFMLYLARMNLKIISDLAARKTTRQWLLVLLLV